MRAHGYRAAVAAPISAGGRMWGLLLVASASPDGLPADAERRLVDFAELMALGLESAEAREQLQASRLRMLEAAPRGAAAPGAQPPRRRAAAARVARPASHLLETQLAGWSERTRLLVSGARGELDLAMKELRELARGLHPAVLTERGLAAGLARSPRALRWRSASTGRPTTASTRRSRPVSTSSLPRASRTP